MRQEYSPPVSNPSTVNKLQLADIASFYYFFYLGTADALCKSSNKIINECVEEMMAYYKAATAQNIKLSTEPNVQNRSLMSLVIFLLISNCAFIFKDFNLFESASEPVRQILGCPPPAYLISVTLAVYCFSSAILTLTAMANDAQPIQKWHHLGYRSVFFVFYCFSGAIAANFFPVLLVGLSLYGLDHCHIWLHNAKENHEGKGLLDKS
ncbi:MAG: hypothetical protein J7J70_00690 [Deltaproteobacteria bacterium]|nr:hypothetical protein [Candidatus Tharpellaceae bacterium]